MLPLVIEVLLIAAAVVVLLYQGAALLLASQMPRLDPAAPEPGPAPAPPVSVVIAARNEVLDLPATLDSVLLQDYENFEVIVVDGGSTDGTRAVIDARAPRVRRVDERPLPEGWVGKNWACAQGAEASGGEWLLFLDADIVLHPAAIRSAVTWAIRERAAAATLAPRVEMRGFWERLVLPFYVQMVLTYFRAPRVNLPSSRAALLNGQFWLVQKAEYEAIGGHAAVRSAILEDIALAQRFRAARRPLRVAWAPQLARTRMYRDRHEMFEGLLKNAHGLDFSAARQVGFLVGLIGLFWLPLGLLPLGVATGAPTISVVGAFVLVALLGKHASFARVTGAPALYGLLYPAAVGFYVAVIGTSLVRGARGGRVSWKGRSYPLTR